MSSWTPISGISVGHYTDVESATGCTVILCPEGGVAGVDVRGGAPGTRETDLLAPSQLVQQVHGILLSGGSAFGLAAADGVMRWLEERGHGFDAGVARVPIVPAAILFDLGIGRADVRPDAAAGYAACNAAVAAPSAEGNVGAGTGCTVGKFFGVRWATKGGLGMATRQVGKLVVNAVIAVNALGDVIDPATGKIVAGARRRDGAGFADSRTVLQAQPSAADVDRFDPSTVIGVVATDAALTKAQAQFVARMAQDGIARTVLPAHTLHDGDTIFALSCGKVTSDVSLVGALAAECVTEAILRGVRAAHPLHGVPAASGV